MEQEALFFKRMSSTVIKGRLFLILLFFAVVLNPCFGLEWEPLSDGETELSLESLHRDDKDNGSPEEKIIRRSPITKNARFDLEILNRHFSVISGTVSKELPEYQLDANYRNDSGRLPISVRHSKLKTAQALQKIIDSLQRSHSKELAYLASNDSIQGRVFVDELLARDSFPNGLTRKEIIAHLNRENYSILSRRTLVHSNLDAIGQIPGDGKYSQVFYKVVDQVLREPENTPVLTKYLYYDPKTDDFIGTRFAWVAYDLNLNILYGVSIPAEVFYLNMAIIAEELESVNRQLRIKSNELESVNRQLRIKSNGLAVLSLIAVAAFVVVFIQRRKVYWQNQELELFDRENKVIIAEKEEIIRERSRYLHAAEYASSYMVILDNENRAVWTNQKFRDHYGAIDGLTLADISNHPDLEKLKEEIRQRRNDNTVGRQSSITYHSRLGDKTVQSELTILPPPNQGWIIIVDTDITQLEEAKTKQENLYQAISHDIRTPLQASLTSLESLHIHLRDDPTLYEHVRNALKDVQSAMIIADNLRESAQYQLGEIPFSSHRLSLYEQVEHATDILRSYSEIFQVCLVNQVDPNILVVYDQERLRSIIRNLISNAVKSVECRQKRIGNYNGIVTLSARSEGPVVIFQVADNGIGMSQEKANTLFAEATIEKGLGSYLIKHFIADHAEADAIQVSSAPNIGTTISFYLPKHSANGKD